MPVESIAEAQSEMTEIYTTAKIEASTPVETLDQWKTVFLIPIAPQAISEFGEFVYARKDEFSEAIKTEVAEVTAFATSQGWWELSKDSRGSKIQAVLRGEEVEDPPVPYVRFKAPVVEAPPPVPPPPLPEDPEEDPAGEL